MHVSWIPNLPGHRGRKNLSHAILLAAVGVLLSTGPLRAQNFAFERTKPHAEDRPIDDLKSRGGGTIDPWDKLAGADCYVPHYVPASAWLDADGVLHIQGTYFNDYLRVESDGSTVEVTIFEDWIPDAWLEADFYQQYDAADVVGIRMYGLAGDDVLNNTSAIPEVMYGGLGDDDLFGGDGVTYAFGQAGDDYILGNGGNDFLSGGENTDIAFGGAGSDHVEGNDGADLVSGGYSDFASDDVVDVLVGGNGGDTFVEPSPADTADVLSDFNPMEDSAF